MRTRALMKSLYVQVLVGIAAGIILGFVAPEKGAAMRPLGDGFIKLVKMLIAPIVLLDRGRRDRPHGRDAGSRTHRPPGAALFRGGVHAGARHRHGRRQRSPAGQRPHDRSGVARHEDRVDLHGGVERADDDRLHPQRHPDDGLRRLHEGRDPAGAALLGPLRAGSAVTRQERRAAGRAARSDREDAVRDCRDHHAAGADRRVRRDGVHRRPLRRRLADLARAADGRHVRHLPAVRVRRARRHRSRRRLRHSAVPERTSARRS